jgi:hypothetical protein
MIQILKVIQGLGHKAQVPLHLKQTHLNNELINKFVMHHCEAKERATIELEKNTEKLILNSVFGKCIFKCYKTTTRKRFRSSVRGVRPRRATLSHSRHVSHAPKPRHPHPQAEPTHHEPSTLHEPLSSPRRPQHLYSTSSCDTDPSLARVRANDCESVR